VKFQIPYVNRLLDVVIPERNIIFDGAPREVDPAVDVDGTIIQALNEPIGTSPLSELVRQGMKVIVISDDNTRPTPTKRIIPILLDFLNNAGIPDEDIQVIISQGTHRPMTDKELEAKYGEPVMSRVEILPHRYKDPDSLVSYGTTERGTNILVNRNVVEADFRIAVGNIIPHHPTGWGAGAKAVLPGVAGEETVAQMHFLGSKDPSLGRLDTEMRKEMEDFADKIGLEFILNVILNREGQLIDAVAGHFIDAHRAGVEISKEVYGIPIPELADITISSTAPVDFDFFQGDKGITSAEVSTRNGGEIVLVSGCLEGVSPAHPELADYVGKMTSEEIWRFIREGNPPDPLTAAEGIVINDIKIKMGITIASDGLSPELCNQMGFKHIAPEALNDYIQSRIAEDPDLKIGILRHSAEVLPILTESA
jgi:nickel-dependent lactate racemase